MIDPGQRRAGLRGKLPPKPGGMKLKFGDYLKTDKLPTLPAHFGHVTNVPPGRQGWQMLGNDICGDCVIAGRCHQIMVEALATGRRVPDFSAGSALAAYSACLVYGGGRPWNPRDPSTDTGLDIQAAAKWWRDVGLTDADGNTHKIDAYVGIDSVDDVLMATYLCGSAGVGLALPETADRQFEAGQVWDDLKSKPTGGHYVPCVGLMGGHLVVVTWGALQGVTREYIQVRMEDAVACLSKEYMLASGLSPELIDWSALLDDIDSLRGMKGPLESAHQQVAAHPHAAIEPLPEHPPPLMHEQVASEPVEEEPAEQSPEPHAETSADDDEGEPSEHKPPPKPHHHRHPDHKPKRKPKKKSR